MQSDDLADHFRTSGQELADVASSQASAATEQASQPQPGNEDEAPEEEWVHVETVHFAAQRTGLQGPTSWKWVVPVVPTRGGVPDEVFSAIRGGACLGGALKEAAEAKLEALRRGAAAAQLGWRDFQGTVPRLPERPLCQLQVREESDFWQGQAAEAAEACRRLGYRVTSDRSGLEVRADVCPRRAFALMLQCLRCPAADLAAFWRVVDGAVLDADPERGATAKPRNPFKLLDNHADSMHEQPPGFQHDLRPEQRRSLGWMVAREGDGEEEVEPLVLEFRRCWRRQRGKTEVAAALARTVAPEWCLDCKLLVSFLVRGGVLADEIGYGKTALVIALIDVQHEAEPPALPPQDEGCFFDSAATLIIVPSNLHQQWLEEIEKFTGRKFKVKQLRTALDMSKATVEELAEADIVLCNYQLLWGTAYEKRRSELIASSPQKVLSYAEIFGAKGLADKLPLDDLRRGTRQFLREPENHPWAQNGEEDLRFPVLEQFYWRRIVFDEFHELEALEFVQRASLQYLRSHYRWGLTGTPALSAAQHVAAMASLLRVDVAGPVPDRRLGKATGPWAGDTDAMTIENCRRFLDACVRQNTSSLPKIKTLEHLVLVTQTPQERALYLAASCGGEAGQGKDEREVGRVQRLLILCSHFSAEQLSAASAGEECGRVLDLRERAVASGERGLRAMLAALGEVKSLTPQRGRLALEERLAELSSAREMQYVRASLQRVLEAEAMSHARLALELTGSECWKRLLRRARAGEEEKAKGKPPGQAELERGLRECEEASSAALEALLAALKERFFLQQTLALVNEDSDGSARACSICLEEDLELQQLGITPCAHVYCLGCLGQLVAKAGKCGICRHPLVKGDVHPVMLEVAPAEKVKEEAGELPKYGTKLGKICETLRLIKAQDGSAKCIVFCQWECLLQKISSAFADLGIRHGQLRGSVYSRMRTLADFKDASSGIDVLLLSLEQSASGTNLTCANHVILVHPMKASTQEQAVAFELQAIGRVRRWGQARNEIHVWRFCTVGTVEEDITKRHQQEAWERGPQEGTSIVAAWDATTAPKMPVRKRAGSTRCKAAKPQEEATSLHGCDNATRAWKRKRWAAAPEAPIDL